MNRRLSLMLAGGCANTQALALFAVPPVIVLVPGGYSAIVDDVAGRPVGGYLRLFGLDFDGFMVKDYGRLDGWVPQLVFVVLNAVLAYAAFRSAPGVRPRVRTVLGLVGAMLLAAGVAELLGAALDPEWQGATLGDNEWLGRAVRHRTASAAAQFALCTAVVPLILWGTVWLLRNWSPFRAVVGTADAADAPGDGDERERQSPPAAAAPYRRRNVVIAGLIPVVLLAVAGGLLLRHEAVRGWDPSSTTFDPELLRVYRPPGWVEEWSGVLYPALRMRPLRTETTAGWAATLGVCLVMLAVLAWALRAPARRALAAQGANRRPLHLFMGCWYATVLAAVAAAFVEGGLLDRWAPRRTGTEVVRPFAAAVGDAVRFGTAWGWATGAAVVVAVLLTTRGGRRAEKGD
ncbi:hypothetical protein [Streptomyces sp. NPDC088258]|uniref:hypothetical protein n=1 Tax=Streptomyces sp. NPDC088258 TaxID=3365849 RepID=UPI0038247074